MPPNKREGRNSPITGSNGETAEQMSPEQLAALGYQMPSKRHNPADVVEVIPDGAIVPQKDGTWAIDGFTLTPIGVQIPDGISPELWMQLGDTLFRLNGAIQWLIGDWLNYGQRVWGKTYEEIAEATGYEVETLYNIASVCSKIDFSLRNGKLNFTHHFAVAYLPDRLKGQEAAILEYAEKNGLSVRDLRLYIKSLISTKSKRIPAASLFTKERAPRLGELRAVYMKARKGDKKAVESLRESVQQYRNWLDDIERSLGIK